MMNNIQNSNIPSLPPQRVAERKSNAEQSEVQDTAQDTVSLSSKKNYHPVSDPVQVELSGILSPISNKTCAKIAEKAVQGVFNSIAEDTTMEPKKAKTVARVAGAIPAGIAYSAGQILDTALNNVDAIANNTKIRLNSVKETFLDPSTSGLKTGLAVAGSILGGVVGTAADIAVTLLETGSAVKRSLNRAILNTVDNLEGTKKKTVSKTSSIARKEDVSIQKLTDSVKKGHGVAVGTALGLSCALLGGFSESAAEVFDMKNLLYSRMEKRAKAKGIDYSGQKKDAWDKYENSNKGIKDKAKLFATRVKQTARKIADVRAGDILRGADSIMKVPERVVINTVRNIGDVFK